jgi:toxin ParE1/3/4
MRIAWTAPAARDLEAIGDYIARQNLNAARRTVQRIRSKVRTLAIHPYLGRPGRIAGTRELVVASTPFIVAYRLVGDRAEILAVIHSARIWPEAF